jgi:hypothetical protein
MANNDDGEAVVFSHPIEAPFGAWMRVQHLRAELEKVYGEDRARQMLREAGSRNRRRRREQEHARWLLLDRYDTMPEPNVDALARLIAEESPGQDIDAIDRQIHRALAERKQKLAAGTWRGPGAPPPTITGTVLRITTR